MHVLGIDQGTTGTRALLMDSEGATAASAYRPHQQFHPQENWLEHDPNEIWQNTIEVIAEALTQAGYPEVVGVGLANQGETCLAWHRDTGEPVYDAIVWQDQRTEGWIQELKDSQGDGGEHLVDLITTRTGLALDSYFSASKMRWLLDYGPGASELVRSGKLCISTLDAWLLWQLSGGRAFVTDTSTAARTSLFDVRRCRYDHELCAAFGVDEALLPEVVPTATSKEFPHAVIRNIAGLEGVPILASIVDQPAALFGDGCLQAGTSKATYGTGCFVYMNTGARFQPPTHGLLSTLAWSRQDDRTYALDGGIFAVGSAIDWLRDGLGLIEDAREIDALLGQKRDASGVACVPAFAGLACPHWARAARGTWIGLSLSHRKEDLIYALLEGIAIRVVEVVRAMESCSGQSIERLRVDGGLTRCRSLMQLQADLLGVPVEVSRSEEATAMGVCYLTAIASGMWGDDESVHQHSQVAVTYRPAMDRNEAHRRIERFEKATAHVLEWAGMAEFDG